MNARSSVERIASPASLLGSGVRSIGAATHRTDDSRRLVTALAIGVTLAPLNSTMIAVALPAIQREFHASVTVTSWLVTLYLVAMAVGQPIGGRLGDLLGRRQIYLGGLLWFAIASIGCALAPSLPVLILFRVQQAIAGALSFPNAAAMIREATPSGQRGSAFGTIGLTTGLAAAFGPPLGGTLVGSFGWQAIFWASVPVVAIAAVAGWRYLPATNQRGRLAGFDITGSALFAAGLAGLLAIPTLIKLDHAPFAILSGIAGVATAAAFVRWERGVASPVVDPALFRLRGFAVSCVSILLSNLVMYTTLLALPLYLERTRGHDARTTGIILAVLSALAAFVGPLGGRWADRVDRRRPAIAGAVLLLSGAAVLSVAVVSKEIAPIAAGLGLMGAGIGVAGAAVQSAAMEAVPRENAGAAAGIFSTSRYLGSVSGAVVLALLFVQEPETGAADRFVWLFAGLALAAVAGLAANARIGQAAES